MKCPACGHLLTKMEVGGLTLDVCKGGCGGIWFDSFELKKIDEPHESAGEELLEIERKPGINVDHTKRRNCPKPECKGMVMMRHFFSVKKQVEVDQCPNCGGYWLDMGELALIREEYRSEEERQEAASEYFSEIYGGQLQGMLKQSQQKAEDAKKIARVFRYICPSNYLPGKQDWGAF